MSKRHWFVLMALAAAVFTQSACVPLAAGVAGAAVGHEVAERQDKKDGDRD